VEAGFGTIFTHPVERQFYATIVVVVSFTCGLVRRKIPSIALFSAPILMMQRYNLGERPLKSREITTSRHDSKP